MTARRTTRLRQLVARPETAFLLEAHSGLSARIVEEAGFEGIWASGLTMSASFGLRDNNEVSWSQVVEHVASMAEATSIPICTLGLLFALPGTQLSRRLVKERRLFSVSYLQQRVAEAGVGDQCVNGLNFETRRPRRDILVDYRRVLDRIYSPDAFFRRVENVAMMLRRPALDRSNDRDPPPKQMFAQTSGSRIMPMRSPFGATTCTPGRAPHQRLPSTSQRMPSAADGWFVPGMSSFTNGLPPRSCAPFTSQTLVSPPEPVSHTYTFL